ncbi:MAG: exodeoxyribonuclease VII small subunit [Clostridiales bacterium]|nr:exodeoxyribonuclease VII small subunit [Clostridiales bacterium]
MSEKTLSLDACFERLDRIVASLDRSDIPLETAVALYEEGAALLKQCTEELGALRNRVMVLREQDGALCEEPFDDGEEGDADE